MATETQQFEVSFKKAFPNDKGLRFSFTAKNRPPIWGFLQQDGSVVFDDDTVKVHECEAMSLMAGALLCALLKEKRNKAYGAAELGRRRLAELDSFLDQVAQHPRTTVVRS